jgi:hypothetical protein
MVDSAVSLTAESMIRSSSVAAAVVGRFRLEDFEKRLDMMMIMMLLMMVGNDE